MSWLILLLGSLVAVALLLVLARGLLFLIRVDGQSMYPALNDGDRVLALRYWPARWLRWGWVVVWQMSLADNPAHVPTSLRQALFIKRITGLPGDRVEASLPIPLALQTNMLTNDVHSPRVWHVPPAHYFVQGDSPGLDSRLVGSIPADSIRGLVLFRLRRRAGSAMPVNEPSEELRWFASEAGDQ